MHATGVVCGCEREAGWVGVSGDTGAQVGQWVSVCVSECMCKYVHVSHSAPYCLDLSLLPCFLCLCSTVQAKRR